MSGPLICVSLTAATTAELRQRRDAVADADLVELRLDSVSDPDVRGALAGRTRPVIITCRPTWEGGAFTGSEDARKEMLSEALDAGAEFIDVEFHARFDDLVRRGGRRVVLSTHDFTGVPPDLVARVDAMRAAGPGVVKIAVTARRLADWLPLIGLADSMSSRADAADPAFTWIAMGTPGIATRVLAARFRSCWTYAGDAVAPGQIPPERLLQEFRFRQITARTAIYGVVGKPLSHSISPSLHNAAFRAAGRDAVYLPFEAADIDDFEQVAAALGVRGASVTIPHKVAFFERLVARGGPEMFDARSRAVGAVNTLKIANGRWEGRNTDVPGFLAPLSGQMSLTGARASILGAGGAARAVAVALKSAGAHPTVHGRRVDRARDVARTTGADVGPFPPVPGSWDLLVNTTPVGMAPHVNDTPWPEARFDGRVVYDLIYNPLETRLLREAAAAGCITIGGLDMVVAQAQEQAEWWSGMRPPAQLLREAAMAALGSPASRKE